MLSVAVQMVRVTCLYMGREYNMACQMLWRTGHSGKGFRLWPTSNTFKCCFLLFDGWRKWLCQCHPVWVCAHEHKWLCIGESKTNIRVKAIAGGGKGCIHSHYHHIWTGIMPLSLARSYILRQARLLGGLLWWVPPSQEQLLPLHTIHCTLLNLVLQQITLTNFIYNSNQS